MIDGVTYTFVGLFQVLDGPADPLENARAAHRQYVQWVNGERTRPWPHCPRQKE